MFIRFKRFNGFNTLFFEGCFEVVNFGVKSGGKFGNGNIFFYAFVKFESIRKLENVLTLKFQAVPSPMIEEKIRILTSYIKVKQIFNMCVKREKFA